MANQIEANSVASVDFDGVMFKRFPAQLDATKFWTWSKPLKPGIQNLNHLPRPNLTDKEFRELQSHEKRHVMSHMVEFVHNLEADVVIGNTGRSNTQAMADMTLTRLEEAGILDRFQYVRFKPAGMSSDQSKYWGLDELELAGHEGIVHYDDNALTQKRLAQKLPHMRFVVVQDLSSGILFSKSEMAKYPNVARIAVRKSGKIEVTHKSDGFGELPFKVS